MAQRLQSITITAPGFAGINTQDAPLAQDPTFASVADNCIIDKEGRIAARKGYEMVSSNGSSVLGSSAGIEAVHQFRDEAGNTKIFTAGNNKLFTGTSTLADATPGSYTVSANNWKIVNFNSKAYFFQRAHEPLVYSNSVGAIQKMSAHSGASGTPPQGNEVLAAFGRLFVADFSTDKSTVFFSDLLDGTVWDSGSAGSIDISKFWPNGYDEIVALAAHNDFLVIFGKDSILLYSGAESPASMTLADTISNIGCVSRDCVVSTGKDLLFLDKSGMRSIARTIQEKSSPIGDISKNVNSDIKALIAGETGNIKTLYSAKEAFVLVNFPNLQQVFVFDTRFPLQDGSHRATTWTAISPLSFTNLADDTIYFGVSSGLAQYAGYDDNNVAFQLSYFSHPLAFGDSSVLKFLKKVNLTTFDGAEAPVVLNWSYDYSNAYKKQAYTLPANNAAQYNISEFNTTAEYSGSLSLINRQKINTSGSGAVVSVGVESTVNGKSIAIQQLNIHALLGRIV
jgi:hypothetical protein